MVLISKEILLESILIFSFDSSILFWKKWKRFIKQRLNQFKLISINIFHNAQMPNYLRTSRSESLLVTWSITKPFICKIERENIYFQMNGCKPSFHHRILSGYKQWNEENLVSVET